MSADQRVLRLVRRACTDRETRKVVLAALRRSPRFRLTKSGITFYGEDGVSTASAHFTPSDHRAARNLRTRLERMGIL